MVQTSWFAPFTQIGRELRIALRMSLRESRFAELVYRARPTNAPILPEQRVDDERIVAQRKAEVILQSVRHGAVRR